VEQIIIVDAINSLAEGRIQLELNNMRAEIHHFPLPKAVEPVFTSPNPLVTIQPSKDRYRFHYGNNRLAFLEPEYFELDRSIDGVEMLVDGVQQQVSFGSIIPVDKQFRINNQKGYRINVVGFTKPGYSNDGNFQIIKEFQDNNLIHLEKKKDGLVLKEENYENNVLINENLLMLISFIIEWMKNFRRYE
jgi:hypothetical protein